MNNDRLVRDSFIFYVATIVFFAIGTITTLGLGWYEGLTVPWWTPPVLVIAALWGMLFVTTVISLSIYCDAQPSLTKAYRDTVLAYMGNALLILFWNYVFFGMHLLGLAFWVALAVGLSVLVLIVRVKRSSGVAAWLLAPYLAWVAYAAAITYALLLMN